MNSNYIINLFGTGIRYWHCEIPIPVFEKMNEFRLIQKVEWETLLFDFDFLHHFGYKHWSELSNQPEQIGFLLDPQNRIEIKQGAKFIARFRANELLNQETLFPLYNASLSNFLYSSKQGFTILVLVQFEKGLVAKFKFESILFSIDDLSFEIHSLKNLTFLKGINLNQNLLERSSDDTLATGCLVLHDLD